MTSDWPTANDSDAVDDDADDDALIKRIIIYIYTKSIVFLLSLSLSLIYLCVGIYLLIGGTSECRNLDERKPQDKRRKDKVLTVFVSSQEKAFWRSNSGASFNGRHKNRWL